MTVPASPRKNRWLHLLACLSCFISPAVAGLATVDSRFEQGWNAYNANHYPQARQIWQPLAQTGHARAQLNLGTLYDFGLGVEPQPATAVHWYRAAALQGNAAAQFNLGMMHASGRGTPLDITLAAAWYRKAADQGIAIAQYHLGMLYDTHPELSTPPRQGLEWLQRAADQHLPDAQYQLGVKYAQGLGVERAPTTAGHWLRQAIEGYRKQGKTEQAERARHALQQLTLGRAAVTAPAIETRSTAFGTGWPIASGYVVTNHHVIENGEEIVLINRKGEELNASVVLTDAVNDIALLTVNDPQKLPPALPLSHSQGHLGMDVFTVGYPRVLELGRTPKLATGQIRREHGLSRNPATFEISVPIQSGNSGGPLLNMHGEVVGLVAAMLGVFDPATGITEPLPNIGYAVKIALVEDLVAQLPQQNTPLFELPSNSGTLDNIAERIKDSVLIIKARGS